MRELNWNTTAISPTAVQSKLWTSTVAECVKQVTIVGLLLTTLGEHGRGPVLSAVDRRSSPVDHIQRVQRDWRLGVTELIARLPQH